MMRPASSRKQASKKALPRGGVPERPKGADCKSAVIDFEGSNPSPTTITFKLLQIFCSHRASCISVTGKEEKLRLRFDSSAARKRCRRQRPEGHGATRRVILPPPPSLPQHKKTESALVGRVRRSRHPATETYIGGKRRLTGELFTIDVLHWACSARPSSSASSCSIDRTTSLMTKQSSPVTLSLSIHSGIA